MAAPSGIPRTEAREGCTARPQTRLGDAVDGALRSEDLFRGRRVVDILHAGCRYRLSLTAMGKLILTK